MSKRSNRFFFISTLPVGITFMAVVGPPNPENRLKWNGFDQTVKKLYSNVKRRLSLAPVI